MTLDQGAARRPAASRRRRSPTPTRSRTPRRRPTSRTSASALSTWSPTDNRLRAARPTPAATPTATRKLDIAETWTYTLHADLHRRRHVHEHGGRATWHEHVVEQLLVPAGHRDRDRGPRPPNAGHAERLRRTPDHAGDTARRLATPRRRAPCVPAAQSNPSPRRPECIATPSRTCACGPRSSRRCAMQGPRRRRRQRR